LLLLDEDRLRSDAETCLVEAVRFLSDAERSADGTIFVDGDETSNVWMLRTERERLEFHCEGEPEDEWSGSFL